MTIALVIIFALGIIVAGLFVGCVFALTNDPHEHPVRNEVPMHFDAEDGL